MVKRTFLLLIVNVAIFCVVAEVVALAVFYAQHGWLFYLDPYRPTYDTTQQGRAVGGEGQALSDIGLAPYFGPVHRPGIPFDVPEALRPPGAPAPHVATNNFGFVSAHDYPFAPAGNQAIVGIFGGSVAAWFCEVGVDRLLADLRQQPAFRSKELVPLCFAHEGYKQPQQLIVLAYFLSMGQRFDLVVNVDGFNEVAIGNLNEQHGWDASMPSVLHLDPLIALINQSSLTPAKVDALAASTRDRNRLDRLAAFLNRNTLASIDLLGGRYYTYLDRRYREELVAFDQLPAPPPRQSSVHVTPPVQPLHGNELFADIAREWMTASALMNQMLAARRVPYVHVLQPNQYYSTRMFSDAERKVAFNTGSPFKDGAMRGYPFLERAIASSDTPVKIFNGVHIFDAEPKPVYIDDCCHYTLVGYEHLADFVAAAAANARRP